MLALSPPLFPTTYGWPLKDFITQESQQDCNDISIEVETTSYNSLLDFPIYDQIQQNYVPENSIFSGGDINSNICDPMQVSKKLNHNASERERRRRVNDLYAYLRSLLPVSSDLKKKVSIPGAVSHALKYIPELQKEVETLIRKKEKLLTCSSSNNITGKDHCIKNQRANEAIMQTELPLVSSVIVLNNKVVIQLISSSNMNKNNETGCLSKTLEYLEEENEFVLLNASTWKCSGDDKSLNTLHFQVKGDYKIKAEKIRENLCSLYQQSYAKFSSSEACNF